MTDCMGDITELRVLLSLVIVVAFPLVLNRTRFGDKGIRRITFCSFFIYITTVLLITLFCRKPDESNTVIYFDIIKSHRNIWGTIFEGYMTSGIQGAITRYHWVNGTIEGHTLNTILFIPFGYLLPLQIRKPTKCFLIFLCAFIFSLSIETTQLFTHRGWFDANDLFHNILGSWVGWIMYKKLMREISHTQVGGYDGGKN